ncbi:SAM-dependent methyltransferase [Isoptericola sp. NPDC056573]|uniref:SAM-dependent methyltransferase n=1 Tax=Isoptericola sp. NPDC056573 TaxID=3345868 RepID=UPI0036A5F6D9
MPDLFGQLSAVTTRPALYATLTTPDLWTDPHISARMLAAHLDPDVDLSTYRTELRERVLAWLVDRFDVGEGTSVADLGCGPGLYTTPLARTGAAVTGLDLSTRSLDHARALARAEGLPVRYLHQDYLAYREDVRYDLVLLIMRDYGALPPEQRRALLGTVRDHLAPGGSFVLDVDHLPAFAAVREETVFAPDLMDGFWSADPYFGFRTTHRYDEERVSLDRYDVVEAERTRTFCNWVRYFDPEELTSELSAAGLRTVDVLGDLSGAPFDPDGPQFAVVATAG